MRDFARYSGGSRLMTGAGVVGGVGLGATALLGMIDARQAAASYLLAFVYWVGLALGSLLLVAINQAARAKWMILLRRAMEATAGVMPVFLVLFIPVALSLEQLYVWVDPPASLPEHVQHLLHHKHGYLNVPFFLGRSVFYLVCWIVVSELLLRWSVQQDETGDAELTQRQRALGPASLPVLALTLSFAAVDWLMSLSPEWFSTIFGAYYFAGSFLGAIALLTLLAARSQGPEGFARLATAAHFHSLGKLMLGFTAFWAYIAYSQYMLIWVANLPEETGWYQLRTQGAWKPVAVALLVTHFLVPFGALLSRDLKLKPKALSFVAVWLLVVHYLDLYWVVMPVFREQSWLPRLSDFTALVGVGGVAVAFAVYRLRGRYLVPVKDPFLADSLGYTQP